MIRVWRLSVAYIGPKSRIEMPRKSKIDIIGLSLLRNDVDCRHFKGANTIQYNIRLIKADRTQPVHNVKR